jgi:hypothetical protein
MQIIVIRDFDIITMMHVKTKLCKARYSTSYLVDSPILQGLMISLDDNDYFWEKECAKHIKVGSTTVLTIPPYGGRYRSVFQLAAVGRSPDRLE